MALQRLLSGNPSRNAKLYLAIGGLSLVKAIAVRNDRERFRRELVDAGMFIGAGLLLRQYSQLKEQKREELESQMPDWAVGIAESESAKQGIRAAANRLQGQSESEPEPTLRDRALGFVASQ